MVKFEVIFYSEDGISPALEWLADQSDKVQEKFRVLFDLLSAQGSRLSRPYAAPLVRKIYELRVRSQNVNFRLLYFFHGGVAAVVTHGCTKEARVDPMDIARAASRRALFLADPAKHTHRMKTGKGGTV